MEEEYPISQSLCEMVEKAVGIDLDHLRNSRTIQPWILTLLRNSDQYSLSVITGIEWEIAMQEARKKVKNSSEEIDAYLIGFDGSIPTVDGRVRGLFYEIGERD